MRRAIIGLAIWLVIWGAAYWVPGHTGGWGILRGLMIGAGSTGSGYQSGVIWPELRDRIGMRLRWWRTRRNGRIGRNYSAMKDRAR